VRISFFAQGTGAQIIGLKHQKARGLQSPEDQRETIEDRGAWTKRF